MQTNAAEDCSYQAEVILDKIRNGETHLRDYLIKANWNNILSTVSRMIGKSANNSDEFSIALQAFNEAIDSYSSEKNMSFAGFSTLVINRRVIDYIRKSSKYNSEYPYTYFESDENKNCIDDFSIKPDDFTQKIEIQEEIIEYKDSLNNFGITFNDLVKHCPKHKDTKRLCISIAREINDNSLLSAKLLHEKRLPVADITKIFKLNRKTVENHRKYIIALYLALKSDMDVIKSYVSLLEKGVQK